MDILTLKNYKIFLCNPIQNICIILYFRHIFFCIVGPSGNNGLAICVTRRTKNGVYRGQLSKNNSLVNGGKYLRNKTLLSLFIIIYRS